MTGPPFLCDYVSLPSLLFSYPRCPAALLPHRLFAPPPFALTESLTWLPHLTPVSAKGECGENPERCNHPRPSRSPRTTNFLHAHSR